MQKNSSLPTKVPKRSILLGDSISFPKSPLKDTCHWQTKSSYDKIIAETKEIGEKKDEKQKDKKSGKSWGCNTHTHTHTFIQDLQKKMVYCQERENSNLRKEEKNAQKNCAYLRYKDRLRKLVCLFLAYDSS